MFLLRTIFISQEVIEVILIKYTLFCLAFNKLIKIWSGDF